MNTAGWIEVFTLTKHNRKGKLKDTYRIFTNQLSWTKGRCDQKGKDTYFESLPALTAKVNQLKAQGYEHQGGELPSIVISRYATHTEG